MLKDIRALNGYPLQKQSIVLLRTRKLLPLVLGHLYGTNHGDFLSFLNYLKPQTEGVVNFGLEKKKLTLKDFSLMQIKLVPKQHFHTVKHCEAFSLDLFNL